MTSKVSITRCADYDKARVEDAVRQAVELAGGFGGIVTKGTKVLLKVNLTVSWPPEKNVTTHPVVVTAAAKILRELGAEVTVGDCLPGYGWILSEGLRDIAHDKLQKYGFEHLNPILKAFYAAQCPQDFLDIKLPDGSPLYTPEELDLKNSNEKLFEKMAYTQVREYSGAVLLPLDNAGNIEVPNPAGVFLKKVWLSRAVTDTDVVITMPKLKTHNLMLYTGAIKNFLGTVPGAYKDRYHKASQSVNRMGEMLVDIFQTVKPQFALMDGITAMEGNGPIDGTGRNAGIIAASRDCVALDAVCASVINYDPMEIPTTRVAAGRELGTADLSDIEVAGTPIEEVRITDFKRPKCDTFQV